VKIFAESTAHGKSGQAHFGQSLVVLCDGRRASERAAGGCRIAMRGDELEALLTFREDERKDHAPTCHSTLLSTTMISLGRKD